MNIPPERTSDPAPDDSRPPTAGLRGAMLHRVTLDTEECWTRLTESTHGVLATLHPERGVDAVPVVFAVTGA